MRVSILALLFLSALPAAAQPGPASPFDGNWAVTLVCPAASDGARGYTYRFPAIVGNAMLQAENGVRGTMEWLLVEGRIGPDGAALLSAQGLTGNPAGSVGRVAAMTPYAYHVRARFTPSHGEGTRVETRPCTMAFDRA